MTKEKKQITYKQLYKIFGVIIYSLAFLIFLLGGILANEYRPVFMDISVAICLFTAVLGVVMVIILAVKKQKEQQNSCK